MSRIPSVPTAPLSSVSAVDPDIEGWDDVRHAITFLDAVVDDIFRLPAAAQHRAEEERERLGDEHGDDLLCGCWSAPFTASALLEMMGRHIEAIIRLSDLNAAFASPAQTLARAVVEQGLRVAWLLEPGEPVDREQRWLALKREEARLFANVDPTQNETAARERVEELDAMRAAIGGEPVPGIPSAEALAGRFTTGPGIYTFYRWLSQPIHGTAVGAGTFDYEARDEWNKQGGSGEWIEAEFWAMPLVATWEAAEPAMRRYAGLLAPDSPIRSLSGREEFVRALRRVPPNYQARITIAAERARAERPQAPNRGSLNRAQRRAADGRRRRS